MTEKYNGWTNYATWRVRLEMFDAYDGASDNDLDAYDLGQELRWTMPRHSWLTLTGMKSPNG